MIDEGWHGSYGNCEFDKTTFPDPKATVDELHELGFKVMFCVVPAVCPDMVGGGMWTDFTEGKEIDCELFVRWAQCSALFPMM